MPPPYARISRLADMPTTLEDLATMINQRLEDINEVLTNIAVADSQVRGNDGYTPTFNAAVNMSRKNINNVARSREPRDAVTRVELEELGIFSNDGRISFTGDVEFQKSARTTAPSGGGNAFITEERVREIIDTVISEALSVAFDGTHLSVRTLGINGRDLGNPVMGRDETGRAEFVGSHNKHLLVHDSSVTTLLTLILHELRRLNGDRNNWQSDAESS